MDDEADSVLQALWVFSWLVSCRGLPYTVHVLNNEVGMARHCWKAPRSVSWVDVACCSSSCLHKLVGHPSVLALCSSSAALDGSTLLSFPTATDPLGMAAAPPKGATRASCLGTKVQEEELSPLTNSVCSNVQTLASWSLPQGTASPPPNVTCTKPCCGCRVLETSGEPRWLVQHENWWFRFAFSLLS